MSDTMTTELVVQRKTTNKIGQDKLKQYMADIASAADKRQQSAGVKGMFSELETEELEDGGGYVYTFKVKLERKSKRSEAAAAKALENAKKFVTRVAEARHFKVLGDSVEVQERNETAAERPPFKVDELTSSVMKTYFDGIYERDCHLRMIHLSVMNAVETNFEERNHILLWGQPAAAKTVLFKRLKAWYEHKNPEIERVAEINSTTLSKAGLETWLLEKAQSMTLPEILMFDEIEKFNTDNLNCLLAIMDDQAKITRTNARIGKQEGVAKVIVWATCNDLDKLKSVNSGALYSRFSKSLPCVRPSRELMLEILLKRIAKRREMGKKANDKWAEIAVSYAFDKMFTNDPRKIISLLDGQDRLLDGSYFKDLEDINKAYEQSKVSGLS